jgi:hypothetical protein
MALNAPLRRRSAAPERSFDRMRSLIMLGLGVPIPLILLLAYCTHHL